MIRCVCSLGLVEQGPLRDKINHMVYCIGILETCAVQSGAGVVVHVEVRAFTVLLGLARWLYWYVSKSRCLSVRFRPRSLGTTACSPIVTIITLVIRKHPIIQLLVMLHKSSGPISPVSFLQ